MSNSTRVLKRDKTEEEYNIQKIVNVLRISLKNSNTICDEDIFQRIIDDIDKEIIMNDCCDVEEIQNIVENKLMENKLYETARHFIQYRYERNQRRRTESYISKIPDNVETPFGPLGYLVFKRTYARIKDDSDDVTHTEEFRDTILRILDASQKQLRVGFTNKELLEAYKYFMELKCSVAGRFLWQLGTKTVSHLGLMSLQNCAFVKIDNPIRPFLWIFDVLMLGTGVGISVENCNVSKLPPVLDTELKIERCDTKDADFIVPDSREGWVSLLEKVLEAYFLKGRGFTYSTLLIRTAGQVIKGFGGVASGAEPLVRGINDVIGILSGARGRQLTSVDCLDIVNIIGTIVVSGNVRRSAIIALGDYNDLPYIQAKNWSTGNIPNWRAMSNNSVVCDDVAKLPEEFWEGYRGGGEPYGLINMDLARKIGRVADGEKYADPTVEGFNPCLTGDTEVLTTEGFVKIHDLVGRSFVAIVNGKHHPSTEQGFWHSGCKDVYKIKIGNGAEIRATGNHKFMTVDSEWCEVEKMTMCDRLILSSEFQGDGVTETGVPTCSIVSIEKMPEQEDVYDCTIPEIHCFVANGIISHNCAEISLSNFETCCLSEIFLPNINSFEELKQVATVVYRICKHSLLLPCHHKETENIVKKNSRIGVGITGYMQTSNEQKEWLSPLYEYLREYDVEYSARIGAAVSIKLTTVKPSGTLSLIPGCTAGAHPAIFQYFLRRIRIASNSHLLQLCKSHGYDIEYQRNFDGTEDKGTCVVSFPCMYPLGCRLAEDMTAIDQLEVIKELQTTWSDNSVSVTIYYKLEELDSIKAWLRENYKMNVKTVSFLLHIGHNFDQAPFSQITKEEYESMMSHIQPITSSTGSTEIEMQTEADSSLECSSGACPVK